jgi:hypothetical protein
MEVAAHKHTHNEKSWVVNQIVHLDLNTTFKHYKGIARVIETNTRKQKNKCHLLLLLLVLHVWCAEAGIDLDFQTPTHRHSHLPIQCSS